LNLTPIYNPVSNLVYAANGGNVDTTIINGQVVVSESRLQTLDEDEVIKHAQERGARLLNRAGIRIQSRWKMD
jgi:5-methylthioadenosine/S-adenosylhomocysteine deaminase